MSLPWLRIGAVAVLLALPVASRASAFRDGLLQAEAIRTSDPNRFKQALAKLDGRQDSASPSEKRLLRVLHGYRQTIDGKYEAAIGDALVLFDQAPEPDIKYRAALLVATSAALTRDFTLGLRYMDHALALQPRIRDPQLRNRGLGTAAMMYNQYHRYELGLHFSNQLLAERPDGRTRCYAEQVRLEALLGLERAVDEDTDIHRAIADCLAQKEVVGANLIRTNLAERWGNAGKVRQALALLDASLPEVESSRYAWLISKIHSLQAQYRLQIGDLDRARAHAQAVLATKSADAHDLPAVVAHRVLSETARQRGDFAAALDEYRLFAEADKARLDDIKAREYAFQLSRHELNQKNQSIELLSNQNEVLRLKQDVAERAAWNFRLAIALLVVLVATIAYWGWRARRMHRNLHQLANTDGLTGLSNRRHFRARSEAMLALCAQRGRPVSVLLFDLDHFKQINDQCGHSSGDWVLREVAKVGRRHCREGDLYGRIGGEEFAMTLVDCDMDAALRIAEQCRRSIDAVDAQQGTGCSLPVAASIGVVSTSISGYDYETLIAHADAAMYRSKVAGRNRVSLYQPPPVPETGQAAVLDSRNAAAMLREY